MNPPALTLVLEACILTPYIRLSLPKAILQLAWRPVDEKDENQDGYDLAVAGEDNTLRIYKVKGTETKDVES